ncbi:hypothetical protein JCM19037_4794 [Geomicrobium sp. JCM 19037]|uniref:AtuA-related protein n=1 Tax=unclassified Geomicrobium TaxID=2628951 RepID=UPI00045F4666|nr:hypothetical protein [Geomicrobium sp. JCM 19037]GAK06214.1 hypothetical protein JCM19037_4794 [Geomicrobium sp. JCM 19037]
MKTIRLHEVAHARAGDKGEDTTISVFLYDDTYYDQIVEQIGAEQVRAHFTGIASGVVECFLLPQLAAVHYVIRGTRKGGVAAALELDAHGKSLGWHLLQMHVKL